MATYEVIGPDRRKYEIEGPPGASKEQVLQILAAHLEANPPAPPRGGFKAAAQSSVAGLQLGATELGEQLGLLAPSQAAEQRADLEAFQKRTFAPESRGWMETPGKAFVETLGGSLPFMVAPVAAGIAGGPGALGLGLAGLVSGTQFTGTNLSRQRAEGQNPDLLSAAGAAVPQAALDIVGMRFIPGLRQIFGAAGKELSEQAAAQTARQILGDYFATAGKAATAEGATEALQQALERAQAGLSISDPAAREEYLESAISGAVLGGTIAAPGRFVERSLEQRKQADEERRKTAERNAQLREQEAAQRAAEEERRKSPSYAHEIEQQWNALELQREKLETAIKTVPAGPSANEERARLKKEIEELKKSDQYKDTREEFKKVFPLVQQMRRAGQQMQPPADGLAGQLTQNRDPLAGRGFTQPEPTEDAPTPDVAEVFQRLQANPEAAQRFLSGEISLPGMPAADQRRVRNLLLDAQETQRQQQIKSFMDDAQGQATNLRELPPAVTPDDEQFIDSAELDEANRTATRTVGPVRDDGSKRPRAQQGEVPVTPPDIFENPFANAQFERALNPPREGAAPPVEGVTPQGHARFDEVDRLFDALEKGTTDRIDRRIPSETMRENEANRARALLDEIKRQEGGHHKMVVEARDRQRAAVDEMLIALDELAGNQVLGEADRSQERGVPGRLTEKGGKAGNVPKNERLAARQEGATPLTNPEQTGGTSRTLLEQRVQALKGEYIRAALEEANVRRTAEGRTFSTDEQVKLVDGIGQRLDELITRLQAKSLKEIGWDGKPDAQPKVDPRGNTTTHYTVADPDGAGKVRLTIKRDKFGKVQRFDADFATGAKADLLKIKEQGPDGQMREVRESYGPGMTDALLVQQLLDAGFRPGTTDKRPLEERPFRRPAAAIEVIKDDLNNFTREAVSPQRAPARVEKPLLRQQFAAPEKTDRTAVLGNIERALQGKPSFPMRRALERAKTAIEDRKASGDLIDTANALATRALRGERAVGPLQRELDDAFAALPEGDETVVARAPDGTPLKGDKTEQGDFLRTQISEGQGEQLDLFGFSQQTAWPVNANNPQINKIKKSIREAREAQQKTEDKVVQRNNLRRLHDGILRQIDALRAKLASFGWLTGEASDVRLKGNRLEPLTDEQRKEGARALGEGWVKQYDKFVEAQDKALEEVQQLNAALRENASKDLAAASKVRGPINERIKELSTQADELRKQLNELNKPSAGDLARIQLVEDNNKKIEQLKDELLTTLHDLNAARKAVVERLVDEMEPQLKPTWDAMNATLLQIQTGLKSWRKERGLLRAKNTREKGENEETKFALKIAEDAVNKLEAEDAVLQASMAHIADVARDGFDGEMLNLLANEDAGVQKLHQKYAALEAKIKFLQSEDFIPPTDAVKARRQAATQMVQARKEADAALKQARALRERHRAMVERVFKIPGSADIAQQLGAGLPGHRREVLGAAKKLRTQIVRKADGKLQTRHSVIQFDEQTITVQHSDGTTERIKVPAWETTRSLVGDAQPVVIDKVLEIKDAEGNTVEAMPIAKAMSRGIEGWEEGAKITIENYERLFNEARERALAKPELPKGATKRDKERTATTAAGPVHRDKYAGGRKELEQVRKPLESDPTFGMTDEEVAEQIKQDKRNLTELQTKRLALDGDLVALAERRRKLNDKLDELRKNQKAGDASEPAVARLMKDARNLEGELLGKSREAADLDRKMAPLIKRRDEARTAAVDAKMANQRLAKAAPDKFGQGTVRVIDKQVAKQRKARRVGLIKNLENASEALRAEREAEVENDEEAFRMIFGGEGPQFERNTDFTFKSDRTVENVLVRPDRSAAFHGMTLAEAAKWGNANTDSAFQKWLFNRLANMFQSMDQPGKVWGAKGLTSHGLYDDATHNVLVVNDKGAVQTLLHELVHAATIRGLESSPVFKQSITRLLETARAHAKKRKDRKQYGLTDEYEFLAEANSDPEFQKFLSEIPSSSGSPKTLWTRFVEAVARLLGLSKPSLLTDVMAATEQAMNLTKENKNLVTDSERMLFERRGSLPDDPVLATPPSITERAKTNFTGLGFRVQMVDRFAAIARAIDLGVKGEKLEEWQGFMASYFMRMADQANQLATQALVRGPLTIETYDWGDHKESHYQAKDGVNLKAIADKVGDAAKLAGWTPEEAERIFTWMALGARANATPRGWERLHSPDTTGSKELRQRTRTNPDEARAAYRMWMERLDASPQAKQIMQEALRDYKAFNDGLIDFNVQAGTISKDVARELKSTPYAPFYRVVGGDVKLFVDSETSLTIGNIKDQPDLQEMVGGHEKVFELFQSAPMNAFMLTRMAMRNKGTMETVQALKKMSVVTRMGNKAGPAGRNVVHYKEQGENRWAIVDTDFAGVPADLIVKGMEGVRTMIPAWVRLLGIPADILRKSVTRSPAYLLRQLVRDPTNAAIAGAVDGIPVFNALNQIRASWMEGNPAMEALERGGAISSNVFTGDARDMTRLTRAIAVGKSPISTILNKLDNAALMADAATRAAVYDDSIRKGLSPAQAEFRAIEIQNFSRRGLSPGMQVLSMIIPFFNAQVQGLDALYRSFTGEMPFAEQLELRKKLAQRAALLMVTSLAYTAAMMDDEDYRKARPEERYQNFFLPNPFGEDWIKIPIPFELGVMFKALPEALLDYASTDTTTSEMAYGLFRTARTSLPDVTKGPTAFSPLMYFAFNSTGFGPLESTRELQMEPRERFREKTSELAKELGKTTGEIGLSPLAIEHFVRGYLGPLGIMALHLPNALLREDGFEPASKGAADNVALGSVFQRREGRHLMDRAYDRWEEIVRAQRTYKNMVETGQRAEAERYRQDKANELAMAEAAGFFRQQAGELMTMERRIRMHPTMPQAEKDRRIEAIRQRQNQIARAFFERTTPR